MGISFIGMALVVIVAIVVIVGVVVFVAGDRRAQSSVPPAQPPAHDRPRQHPPGKPVPDRPPFFGYKNLWLAVGSDSPEAVQRELGLTPLRSSSWKDGLEAAHREQDWVFVSPVINGYVLVIGLPRELDEEGLARMSGPFDDLQYYASHSVPDLYAWARAARGQLLRYFRYCGGDGEAREAGERTAAEADMDFARVPVLDEDSLGVLLEDDDCELPDWEDVLDVAEDWCTDLRLEERQLPPSLGWVCRLPKVF